MSLARGKLSGVGLVTALGQRSALSLPPRLQLFFVDAKISTANPIAFSILILCK